MSEFQNNPLNDFLAQMEKPESNSVPLEIKKTEQELISVENDEQSIVSEVPPPISGQPAITQETDPFTAALQAAQQKSEKRKIEEFAEKEAVFSYGNANDPITDRDNTFEDLRLKYQSDFPELSDAKKVTWTMVYGKITKSINNPGSDKVYDLKSEIENSKSFLEGIKKAKNNSEKNPECMVKPRVMAQSKGEMQLPQYKDYCASTELAHESDKPIIVIPSRNGKLYEMRKNQIGIFTTPADNLPEFPEMETGFEMRLPKIPISILNDILSFFRSLSNDFASEGLAHILYDKVEKRYLVKIPKQEVTRVSVNCTLEEYPDDWIHVMDIHSHHTMPAVFSKTDDEDEKATRLYAVVGRIDLLLPEITVRASCGGKFIPVQATDVFSEMKLYPKDWNSQIAFKEDHVKEPFVQNLYNQLKRRLRK